MTFRPMTYDELTTKLAEAREEREYWKQRALAAEQKLKGIGNDNERRVAPLPVAESGREAVDASTTD